MRRIRLNLTRYTAASVVATTITQVVLLAFALIGGVPAVTASTVGFVAGAVPQFLIIRRWALGQLPQQVITFIAVTVASGTASIGMVALVDAMVGPSALVLNLGYLLGGAPIFLIKFLVLDRTFFAGAQEAYEEASSTRVRVANPVAPAVTSS